MRNSILEPELGKFFTEQLACQVSVAVAQEPIPLTSLTLAELKILESFKGEFRKHVWRTGRNALKCLLEALKSPIDTANLQFPHPYISLTHCAGMAVAVATNHSLGIGVDYQANSSIKPESGRFFLTNSEKNWLSQQSEEGQSLNLLRLWTIKEALFKADLNNVSSRYFDFETETPGSCEHGKAWQGQVRYNYATLPWNKGFLSIAVRQSPFTV